MSFVVENNVPIAKKAVARQRSPLREALANLELGQCVTVFPEEGQSMKALRARLSGLTQGAKQDNPHAAFIHRTVDAQDPNEGDDAPVRKAIRIWRVEPEQAGKKPAAKKKAASKKKTAARSGAQAGVQQAGEGDAGAQGESFPPLAEGDEEEAAESASGGDDDDPFDGAFDEGATDGEEEDPDDEGEEEDPDDEGEEEDPDDDEGEEEEDPFGWDSDEEADLERPAQVPNL